jgi:hypothetical protein
LVCQCCYTPCYTHTLRARLFGALVCVCSARSCESFRRAARTPCRPGAVDQSNPSAGSPRLVCSQPQSEARSRHGRFGALLFRAVPHSLPRVQYRVHRVHVYAPCSTASIPRAPLCVPSSACACEQIYIAACNMHAFVRTRAHTHVQAQRPGRRASPTASANKGGAAHVRTCRWGGTSGAALCAVCAPVLCVPLHVCARTANISKASCHPSICHLRCCVCRCTGHVLLCCVCRCIVCAPVCVCVCVLLHCVRAAARMRMGKP